MSLEGNLTAFGLSEILQLIAVQQKSGMLSVASQAGSRVLFFREGLIISTRDRRRKTKDPFKDYLTRYGILSREDLLRLAQISAQSKLDITDIIVSEDFMSEEDMQRHHRDHVQEAVHEILTWEQCSYKFIPGRDIIDGIKTWGDFNIEGMLMESMRRIDEFPQMLKEFPDPAARIMKLEDPEEDQELTSNEKAVLAILEEEHPLNYLIAHAKMPKFETYEALKHLKEKNLVKAHVPEGIPQGEKAIHIPKVASRRQPRNALPIVFAILLFCASLLFGGRTAITQIRSYASTTGAKVGKEATIARNRTEHRLRWALEAYYARRGEYPAQLTALKKEKLADDGFLDSIKRHSLRYRLTEQGRRYTLL
jgi:hypothetical protein